MSRPKMFDNKRNGYVDLKGGGWGVEIHGAKQEPQHGDKVFIDLSYMDIPDTTEEFVDQVLGESIDLKGQKKYVCSIQSQETIEKLLARNRM